MQLLNIYFLATKFLAKIFKLLSGKEQLRKKRYIYALQRRINQNRRINIRSAASAGRTVPANRSHHSIAPPL
jgi:hypothetical protein